MKVSENILAIIDRGTIANNTFYLPPEQLDRKTYLAVNTCLENIGGKWNRKAKGHVFDCDPTEAVENLLATGETENQKKVFQFFPTPRPIAEQMCDMAELGEQCVILEPSCGKGDLMKVILEKGEGRVNHALGIELNPAMDKYLKGQLYDKKIGIDFLDYANHDKARRDWTHIIMNPPFTKQQDIDHIRAAFKLLGENGILVSVVSPSPFFRSNKKSQEFRDWLDQHDAEVIDIPAGAFKESGTDIASKIIKIRKAAA